MNESTTPRVQGNDPAEPTVWVVLSHGDSGAFVSAAFTSQDAALDWATKNEVMPPAGVPVVWEQVEETGAGRVWESEYGDLTVRVTPVADQE